MYYGRSVSHVDQRVVLQWLREQGAVKAVASAWGYNDEGGCDGISLIGTDGKTIKEVTNPNYYWEDGKIDESSPEFQLWEWLGAPLEDEFGGWAGEDRVGATSTLDVATGKVESHGYRDSYSRSEW